MIIDRYIARSVFKGVFGALSVMAALFAFIDFVRQLEHIGTRDFGLLEAVFYVALGLPQRLYELAPTMILLGGLISLGAMAASSELVVMRASGIKVSRIIRSVLQAGFLLAILVALAGEFVVPYTTSMATSLRATAMDDRLLAGGDHGVWARDGNRYLNIGRVLPDMQLLNINIHELDEQRHLVKSTHAKRGSFQDDAWVLQQVSHSEISSKGVEVTHNAMEIWPDLIKLELFDVLRLDPEDMSAIDLFNYSRYLDDNELDAVSYKLVFWVKVFTPLTCMVMLLIAMPLVLGSSSRSSGTGYRIIIGILLGVMFYVFNSAINNLGVVYGMTPLLSAIIPLLVVFGVAVLMIRRVR